MIRVTRDFVAPGIRAWVSTHTVNVIEAGIVKKRFKESDTTVYSGITEVIAIVAMKTLKTLAIKQGFAALRRFAHFAAIKCAVERRHPAYK